MHNPPVQNQHERRCDVPREQIDRNPLPGVAEHVGKIISDLAAILMGKEAIGGTESLIEGMVSWKSILGLILGLVLLAALIFFDWRTLLQRHRLRL